MSKKFDINPAELWLNAETAAERPTEAPEPEEAKIPAQTVNAPETAAERAQEPFKPHREPKENKTRRVQLVLRPSLYERLKEEAAAADLSVNDYIHQLLESALKGE